MITWGVDRLQVAARPGRKDESRILVTLTRTLVIMPLRSPASSAHHTANPQVSGGVWDWVAQVAEGNVHLIVRAHRDEHFLVPLAPLCGSVVGR